MKPRGYKYNKFPNRKTRRRMAKLRGYFGMKGMWAWSNSTNKNVQTWRKK